MYPPPYKSKPWAIKSLVALCEQGNYDHTVVRYLDEDLQVRKLECPNLSEVRELSGDKWGGIWKEVIVESENGDMTLLSELVRRNNLARGLMILDFFSDPTLF